MLYRAFVSSPAPFFIFLGLSSALSPIGRKISAIRHPTGSLWEDRTSDDLKGGAVEGRDRGEVRDMAFMLRHYLGLFRANICVFGVSTGIFSRETFITAPFGPIGL